MTGRGTHDPVRRFLQGCVERDWMPGATWWVEGPAGVASRGAVGSATIEPAVEPAEEATPYDLASLTKMLATAPLLGLLAQEGRLDLTAPASDWLPELRGTAVGRATLAELAAHRAGLPAWAPLYLHADELEGYLASIAEQKLDRPPRTLYSDVGYILLGAVLHRIGGGDLAALFRDRIAAPLGLSRSGFAGKSPRFVRAASTERGNAYERELAGRAGASHAWRTEIVRGTVHDGNAHALGGVAGHAGLFGTAEEVAAICREILRPERTALGGSARDRLLGEIVRGEGRTLGMVDAAHSQATRGILPAGSPGHTGFTGTSAWLDPAGGRLFVLLTNRVHPRVPQRNFQWLRRGFHRLAARATLA